MIHWYNIKLPCISGQYCETHIREVEKLDEGSSVAIPIVVVLLILVILVILGVLYYKKIYIHKYKGKYQPRQEEHIYRVPLEMILAPDTQERLVWTIKDRTHEFVDMRIPEGREFSC